MTWQIKFPWLLSLMLPLLALVGVMLWAGVRQPSTFSLGKVIRVCLAFLLGIIALSRPQMGHHATKRSGSKANLFIAFDVSKSMLAEDITPSRLKFGISFAQKLLEQLPDGIKVALFPFTRDTYPLIPLTSDLLAASDMLTSLNPNLVTSQGTDISTSLGSLMRHILTAEENSRKQTGTSSPNLVLLISDGESHFPLNDSDLRLYADKKIPVFVLGVGGANGAVIPNERRNAFDKEFLQDNRGRTVTTKINVDILRKVSALSRGELFTGSFSETARMTQRMKQSMEFGKLSQDFVVEQELFPYFLLGALFLFFLQLTLAQWEYAVAMILMGLALGSPSIAKAEAETNVEDADPATASIKQYNLGLRYLKDKNFTKAAELFQEAAAQTKDPELKKQALYNLGNAFLQHGDPQQALDAYQQARDTTIPKVELEKEANQRASDNMALAARVLEQMKSQPQEGEGKESDEENGKKEGSEQDRKGPKQFSEQQMDEGQKKRFFDLVSAEEQQSLQRIQEQKNRNKAGSDMTEKPW